jgi:hypothetical protein
MTINQVKSLLNNLATAHKQINDYGWGDVWELGESDSITYPLMYCTIGASSIVGNEFNLSIQILFMDLVFGDNSNIDDVISDQMLICQDIIAQLRSNDFEFIIEDNVPIQFFTERFSDLVAGVSADITLSLPYVADRCAVPTDYVLTDGN